ncbi:hypothetical protein B566_EDAN003856 [Ephemera danica]|nr:hypothetical protein B566_EDAN003856 [Ephemera danica]
MRKSVVGAIIAGSASCDSSPFMKRANSPARGKGREKQRSLECSRPSTPSEEESSSAGSLPRSTSEGMGSLSEEAATGTMEGLARQALLAARVFNLIPVEKARERLHLMMSMTFFSLLNLSMCQTF